MPSRALSRPASATLAAAAAALPAAHPAAPSTYYVDPVQGDDANPGGAERPWRSLSKAAAAVDAGDSIRALPGTCVDPAADP